MNHTTDLAVAVAGILLAIVAAVLGAWFDLRPDRRDDES
jgi:MFS-type transporter involved in bile tolerance (Atg22 family)